MTETSRLALGILRSTGLYSEEALARIESGREANPGMGLVEAVVKFGGVREAESRPGGRGRAGVGLGRGLAGCWAGPVRRRVFF